MIQPHEYDDAPEMTLEQMKKADLYEGDKLISRGRPKLARPKEAVKLRISPDVLDHFRSSGKGWQTRINEPLERVVAREKRKARG